MNALLSIIKNLNKVTKHTSCRYDMETNSMNFYITETFLNTPNYILTFLKNLTFLTDITPRKETTLKRYTATGPHEITFVTNIKTPYQKNRDYKPNDTAYFCPINLNLINKFINDTDPNDLYDDFYLSIMFDNNMTEKIHYKDLYYEDELVIIFPLVTMTYINKDFLQKLTTKQAQLSEEQESLLSSVIFQTIIKPTNYIALQNKYLEYLKTMSKVQRTHICFNLLQQPYISAFHVLNNNVPYTLLLQVQTKIHKFYETKFNITNTASIKLNIATFHPHNLWMQINANYKSVYKIVGSYVRLTSYHGTIPYDVLLTTIKNHGTLDNQYTSSFKKSLIRNYNLTIGNNTNINDCNETSFQYHKTISTPTQVKRWLLQRQKITPINNEYIKKNNFLRLQVLKIYSAKLSTYNKLCPITLLAVINDKYYIINIIQDTLSYIEKIFSINPHGAKEYLQDELVLLETLISPRSNETSFYHCHKNSLKYVIEIIPVPCAISNFTDCKLNSFEAHNAPYLKNIYSLDIIENETLAFEHLAFLQNNFTIQLPIVIYNIIQVSAQSKILPYAIPKLLEFSKKITTDNYLNYLLDPYIKSNYTHNKYIWNNDNLPFIAIASRRYVLDDTPSNFKYLIWYCHYKQQITNEILDMIIELLYQHITSFNNTYQTIFEISLSKDAYTEIFNTTLENYLFNATSLFNQETLKFNEKKKELDTFLKNFKHYINKPYVYTYFHYYNGQGLTTLHLHIIDRNFSSDYESEINEIYDQHAVGPLINDAIYNINNNYDWFTTDWIQKHNVRTVLDLDVITKDLINLFKLNTHITINDIINLVFKRLSRYGNDYLFRLYELNKNTIKEFITYVSNQSYSSTT